MDKMFIISRESEAFPKKLLNVKPKIKKLYGYGNINLLNEKSVAIVGSRNYSSYGKKMTELITQDLVASNITIVSGMAVGVDSIAHETCIKNGGKTIAVLGSGFNKIYPKENTELFHAIIASGGLVLSEYPLDECAQKRNFPRRNRIISGISDAVVVTEGGYRSGTSITAHYALAQGKKVFSVPNCMGNKNSYGTIALAKEGGIIATCGSDILKYISDEAEVKDTYKQRVEENNKYLQNLISQLDEESRMVFDCLMVNGDLGSGQISIITQLNIIRVNQILSKLELDELICCTGINKYKVRDEFCE